MSPGTLALALSVALAPAFFAQTETGVPAGNIHTVKFQSAALGQERAFNILLPGGYEKSPRRYGVLYLLHGLGDNHMMWPLRSNVSAYAERSGVMVVMPDASRSFYVNSAAGEKARFEDYLVKDLVDYVDAHYRTLPLRRRPEIEALFGAPGSATRRERDPFPWVEKVPAAEMPFLYVACGGQDFLIAENRAFVELLAKKGMAYEYREISPRGHSWDFWDDQVRVFLNVLQRLSGFQREGHPLHARGPGGFA
jgi:S-formylglutathione hydrolase FrmB